MEHVEKIKIKNTDKQLSIFRFGVMINLNLNEIINCDFESKWCVEVPKNYKTVR